MERTKVNLIHSLGITIDKYGYSNVADSNNDRVIKYKFDEFPSSIEYLLVEFW